MDKSVVYKMGLIMFLKASEGNGERINGHERNKVIYTFYLPTSETKIL